MSGPSGGTSGGTSGATGGGWSGSTSWLSWRGPEHVRGPRSLESRAFVAFLVIAALNVPGIIVSPWGGPPSWLLNVTSVVAAIGTTVIYLLEARGISRHRRWALLALRPLLVVVIGFGSYAVVVAAQQGFIKVPVDVGLAVWALLGPKGAPPPVDPEAAPERGPVQRAVAAVAVVVLLQGAIWYGPPIFGWGGFLDVQQADFDGSFTVDCGPGGGPPPVLTVTYEWSWRSRGVFPSGVDVVVIGWDGVDGSGRTLYLLGDDSLTPAAGVQPGFQEAPSLDLARAVEAQSPGSWHWGLRLGEQGYAPGRIQFTLDLAHPDAPQPGPLTIRASYVHLGLWHTDEAPVTCTW